MKNEKIKEAYEIFGREIVNLVVSVAEMADPDGAYCQFQDMDMFEYAECTEFLYFE